MNSMLKCVEEAAFDIGVGFRFVPFFQAPLLAKGIDGFGRAWQVTGRE
jgi:hypothetical protein